MKKNKLYHSFNPPPHYVEKNDGSSITNPDPGLTIAQMVERYVLSGEMPPGKEIYYDDSEDTMIESGIDLSDLTAAVENYERSISHAKTIQAQARSKPPRADESGGSNFREAEGQRRAKQTTKEGAKRDVREADTPPDSDDRAA